MGVRDRAGEGLDRGNFVLEWRVVPRTDHRNPKEGSDGVTGTEGGDVVVTTEA